MNATSVWYFLATVAITLVVTAWASRRTKTRSDYYAAGGRVGGTQNGLAIAGDFMSATAFLGVTALYFSGGFDILVYYAAPLVGLLLILLLIATPLRRLGTYTLGDALVARLARREVRAFSGLSTIVISLTYLVVQLVGAGSLVATLFGLSFESAVVIVGALMALYVTVGGMLAATWVQIIKATLLVTAVVVLAVLCVLKAGGVANLYQRAAAAHTLGWSLFQPGGLHLGSFAAISLSVGFILGMLGLPHLLIRLFTVPDAATARQSVVTAMIVIGGVFATMFLLVGPGAVAFVAGVPAFHTADGALRGGGNVVVMHLATALGGPVLFGVTAAVAFATILAVVSGLTIAAASAASHDLYPALRHRTVPSQQRELVVFRLAAVLIAAVAVGLAVAFQKENVAFLTALVFAVAASSNFPVLFLTLYWKRTTTAGVLIGGSVGLVSSVGLIIASPAVWVKLLGHAQAAFPADYPTLVTAPLAFLAIVAVSLMTGRTGSASR